MISESLRTTEAKHELILKHVRMAEVIACNLRRNRRCYGIDPNEVKQQARWALVHGVEAIANGAIDHHTDLNDNVERYLNMCVVGKVKTLISRHRPISLSIVTFQKRAAKGKKTSFMEPDVDFELIKNNIRDERAESQGVRQDIEQILQSILRTEQERKIVELVAQNFNGQEIADQLKMTRSNVSYHLQNIRKRAQEYVAEHGPVC